jgi:RNA polymerase sigma-70 factor (ECF subfamily)
VADPIPPSALSFEQVYREHFAFVWRSLRRLGIAESDAADVTQEVFLVAHRRLGEFESRAKVSTWLFRICLNIARDHQRRAASRREDFDDTALDGAADPREDPEEDNVRRDGLEMLERALESMGLEHRTVFILFELEGMLCSEIADVLELPLGTVYSRLRRGRELFDRALKRQTRVPLGWLAREGA